MEAKVSVLGVELVQTPLPYVFDRNDQIHRGDNTPIKLDQINLLKNSDYTVEVILLDKSKTPADTISNEVLEEANDHLFFYSSNPLDLVKVAITDKDGNGKNLGLKSTWTTTNAGSGKMKVKLMHQPGVKDGTSPKGGTDIEVDFQVNVK